MVSKLHDIPGTHVQQTACAGQGTAGTTDEFMVFRAPYKCTIVGIGYVPTAAATGHTTNYMTLAVTNEGGDGQGSTAVASLAFTAGVDFVAGDEKALTLSGTAANLNLAEGDVLMLAKSVAGSGLAMADGLVVIQYKAR